MNKTLIIPRHLTESYITSHPELIFVYSNDYHEKGCLGMAWNCYGKPNCYSVPTLVKYCSAPSFYYDGNFKEFADQIDGRIARIPRDYRRIIVLPKIGMGCSRMKELAPKLYSHMWVELDKIRDKNYTVDWNDTRRHYE